MGRCIPTGIAGEGHGGGGEGVTENLMGNPGPVIKGRICHITHNHNITSA
jgi:hypothetical protein